MKDRNIVHLACAVAVIALLLLSAHFLRSGAVGLAIASVLAAGLLWWPRLWALQLLRLILWAGALLWADVAVRLISLRIRTGQPWGRLAVILALVTGCSVVAACLLQHRAFSLRHPAGQGGGAPLAAALLTGGLLTLIQAKVPFSLLLLERFLPGWGSLEIFLLALYAAFWTERMSDPAGAPAWRRGTWLAFSIVFFGQLALGLAGIRACLQTGTLHLPVPVAVLAGPIYRGGGFFMVILFLCVVVLAGPAWCSHLCYFGGWDARAAMRRNRPESLPAWRRMFQWLMVALVAIVALLLRLLRVDPFTAALAGVLFGLAGLAVMLTLSRRKGVMVHCVAFCPLGLVATVLGRLNPFRLRLDECCNGCGACRRACRYDALSADDIRRGRPGASCTLCGDCLPACRHGALVWRFPGLTSAAARALFLVLAAALHATFLGVARI